MAAKKNSRTQARRSNGSTKRSGGMTPAQVFVGGAVIGAAVLFGAPRFLDKDGDGFMRPKPDAEAQPSAPLASEQVVADGAAVVAKSAPAPSEPIEEGTEFDFYTVLPGKEVEMTAAQQASLNRAQQRRVEYADLQERRKAEQEAAMAATTADVRSSGSAPAASSSRVEIMPDMAEPSAPAARPLPKPVSVAKPAATSKPETVRALPKPVAAVVKPTPVVSKPVATVKDRPVKLAAATAAEAPKPKAKAVAAYSKNPDVTATKKGVAMVMPKGTASVEPAKVVASRATPASSKLILQAGAYGDQSQAEKVKAKIALLGLGARVESSSNGGKNVYRVRLGPYAENSTALDAAKRKLSGGGLSAMEVRVN